jgi:hypothetical protein
VLALEEQLKPLQHDGMIVGDDESNRHPGIVM